MPTITNFAPIASTHFVAAPEDVAARHQAISAQLRTLDNATLERLQNSFFEMAARSNEANSQSGFVPFAMRRPADVLGLNQGLLAQGYHQAETAPNSPRAYSSPSADRAQEAVRQAQAQRQNLMAAHLGQAFAADDNTSIFGAETCYEDALAAAMMSIADRSEKDVMEQIRSVERGETGLGGFISNGARSVGGMAGGAIGGYVAGLPGAAIGHDVGERIAGSVANQYGGSSRQVQFEKLKMSISKQSELMLAISNILATLHATKKNTISNMRG